MSNVWKSSSSETMNHSFHAIGLQGVADLGDEIGVVLLVGGIELLPVEHQAAGLGFLKVGDQVIDEAGALVGGAVRDVFHRFRLPGVAREIPEDGHQREAMRAGESHQPLFDIHDEPAIRALDGEPLRRHVGERSGMTLQGGKGVWVPIHIQPETDFTPGLGRLQLRRIFAMRSWAALD